MTFSVFLTAIALDLAFGRELVFSNVVWRHGDRSYIQTYPTDPYKDSHIWKNGYGELTNIGMKEQYDLGRYLRIKYNDILDKEYLKAQIYVRSTDKDRAIMSAQSNLAGLYPVTKDEMWNGSSTNWHPMPVHVVPVKYEDLLIYPRTDCPKYDEIMSIIRHSPWFLEHEQKYSEFYRFIEEKTGLTDVNLLNIWGVSDNLLCLQSHNFTLPEWVTDDVMTKLQHLNSLEMGLMFSDINYKYRKEISQMQGGVLLKTIIQNMEDHKAGRTNFSMIAYSAHDTTLVPLLMSLGNYDWIQPDYASCIMVDLYRTSEQYEVSIQYRRGNGTVTTLQVYGCDTFCSFQEFAKILQDYIPDDYSKVCNKNTEEYQNHAICDEAFVVISLVLFVIVIITIALLVYRSKRNRTDHKYSPVSMT